MPPELSEGLRNDEEQFGRVVEALPNSVVVVDPDGRIKMLNALAERAFGYSGAELLGQPVETLLPKRYRGHHPSLRMTFLTDPRPRAMGAKRDLYAVRRDGSEFPVEIGLGPMETAAGTIVLVSIIDITERRETEKRLWDAQRRSTETLAALSESEEQLKRTQRLAHIGSDVRDLRTDEAVWSEETYRIFGVSRETYIPSTENFLRMLHPDDRETVLTTRGQIAQGICPEPFEYRIIRPDGSLRIIYRETELIRDEAGNPLYMAGTIHDVTEQRRIEQQLRQAQKIEAIGHLTGGIAHDFNNLIGIIIGNLSLASERIGADEELREIIGEAQEAAWRGADLTRPLLAFARRQPLRSVQININELVSSTVRLLRRWLGVGIDITLNLSDEIWPVSADPAQLESSLTNLATNARDAMPKGGRLMITTANRRLDADYSARHPEVKEGDFTMIEVSDTGIGMPPEIIEQIFEPFFTTKEPGKGTGLGLSMVFGFLRQSGGHVNVYSEPGVGTSFRLYLPRLAEPSMAPVADPGPAAHGAGETILVAEDNDAMRRVAVRQLCELGYRVLECDCARVALDLLQHEPVDLLFTDIVMPGDHNGVELARIALQRWPRLKVVLTSGFSQAPVSGTDDLPASLPLLSKPYCKDRVAAVLRQALGT